MCLKISLWPKWISLLSFANSLNYVISVTLSYLQKSKWMLQILSETTITDFIGLCLCILNIHS